MEKTNTKHIIVASVLTTIVTVILLIGLGFLIKHAAFGYKGWHTSGYMNSHHGSCFNQDVSGKKWYKEWKSLSDEERMGIMKDVKGEEMGAASE